jgi:HEAT repeat protein
MRRHTLTQEQIARVCRSPRPEAREAGLRLLGGFPPAFRDPLLLDLVLDDVVAVRCAAIRLLGALVTSAAADTVLTQSLRDPDPDVARAAVDSLINRRTPAARRTLTEFLSQCDRADLAAYIHARLEAEARRPTVPARPVPRPPSRAAP